MKTIILYATKYGATKQCAERIAAKLPEGATLQDLDASSAIDLAPYDTVILGTSIYMGRPRKAMKKFVKKNEAALLEKKLGLFLCCIQDIDKNVREQFSVSFPKALLEHASAMEPLGAIVDLTQLKPLDKMVMNMILSDVKEKTGSSVLTTITDDRINIFVKQLG